jgi:uncharacterized membrane protein YfcA
VRRSAAALGVPHPDTNAGPGERVCYAAPSVDVVAYVALPAVGLVAGCVNTIAGGGSLTTVPVLMLLGLPADVANATNRVAIVSQSLAATGGFVRAGAFDKRGLLPVLATSAIGALGGALVAAAVPVRLLEIVLCVAMIGMAGLLLVRPTAVVVDAGGAIPWAKRPLLGVLALFATGFYGGLVQAGVGFLLVATLSGVVGYGIGPTTALKSLATLVFSTVALLVFVGHGMVAWGPGLILAIFTALGSLVGVKLALKTAPRTMRWLLFVGVVATSIAAIAH